MIEGSQSNAQLFKCSNVPSFPRSLVPGNCQNRAFSPIINDLGIPGRKPAGRRATL